MSHLHVYRVKNITLRSKVSHLVEIISILVLLVIVPGSSNAFTFSDDFSLGSSNWSPISGMWAQEGGTYKHEEGGINYVIDSSPSIFEDDFSLPNPSFVTTAIPFTDSFTEADGPASQWSVKRGAFSIGSSEYVASNGSSTLSVPADSNYWNWTDYRIRAKIKRCGQSDVYGYAIIYFRLTMVDATHDNSYALIFRQTGVAELWKRVNGSWSLSIGSFAIPKDNNWHDVIVLVNGSSLKVWFDKTEDLVPDLSKTDLTDYSQGTIGVGTQAWDSNFDDIQVESISINYRWLTKQGQFDVQSGEYYATNSGYNKSLSILSDASSPDWTDYRIRAKIKRYGQSDVYGYAIIYFRLTMVDATHDNSYALIFRQTGVAELWKRVNGSWGSNIGSFAIPKDNNWHDVIALVNGSSLKVWFDKTEEYLPDLSMVDGLDYPVGTIGFGTTGWNSGFDDVTIDPQFSIQTSPFSLYTQSNNTTSILISSSYNLNNLQLTVTNPSHVSWNLSSPPQCIDKKTCQVIFPTDFPGASITDEGTYLISAINGGDNSCALFEVREKPLFSFLDITDMHNQYSQIRDFVNDTNASRYFPLPDFVILTGDFTNSGQSSELAQVKTELDRLTIPYYPLTGNHDTDSESGNSKGSNWALTFGTDKFTYGWIYDNFLVLAMDVEAPYGGYGKSLNSTEHMTWLQNVLNANPDKYVLLFAHYALQGVRDDGAAKDYWQLETNSAAVRQMLEVHGKVIAQIAGHNHLNGMKEWNGIYYITTGSFLESGVYRHVDVYSDRIETQIIKKKYYCSGSCISYWTGETDSTHGTSTYSYGLPIEREFKIHYATKTVSIMDGISVAGDMSWQDYTYGVDVSLANMKMLGENVGGLIFRYNDKDNYYSVLLDSASDSMIVQKKQNGVVTDLSRVSAVIDLYTVYNLKVNVQGNRIKVYLNDLMLIDISDNTFISGKIGLRSFRSNTNYDNVSVTLNATNADPNGPYSVTAHQMMILDGSESYVAEGKSIVLYEWDMNNDGLFEYSSSSPTLSYMYTLPGIYYARLRVTDNLGDTDEALTVIEVAVAVTADFTASSTLGIVPHTVYFTNLSTGFFQPLNYAWDFNNDGIIDSTEKDAMYTYIDSGIYTVKLTVTDNIGITDALQKINYISSCLAPVRIANQPPVYFNNIQSAYDLSLNGDKIQGGNITLTENLIVNRDITVTFNGGYGCDFTTTTGKTRVSGTLTISDGILIIEDGTFELN